jgi:hypothetical protein
MEERKPTWSTSSFLVYAGGFTVLGSAVAALGYLSSQYGKGAFAAWAFLVLVVLYGLAHAFRRRDRFVAAGMFVFAAVAAWAVFVGALWSWFGWLNASFDSFSLGRLSLELLVLAAAWDDRRRFGFPLLRLVSALVAWIFVLDLLSSGGTWSVVVSLLMGLLYLAAASGSDKPSAFWLHVASGLLIGGSLLYWWHTSDWQWALIAVASVVYVGIARGTARSSWAVLAAFGLTFAATHFAVVLSRPGAPYGILPLGAGWTGYGPLTTKPPIPSPSLFGARIWAAIVTYAVLGFLLVALGLLVSRGRTRGAPSAQ